MDQCLIAGKNIGITLTQSAILLKLLNTKLYLWVKVGCIVLCHMILNFLISFVIISSCKYILCMFSIGQIFCF